MKKLISFVLALIFCCVTPLFAFASPAPVVFKTAADLMDFVMVSKDYTTPVRIVPAELTKNGESRDVFLVAMLGMKNIKGQVNSAQGGGTTQYASLVKTVLFETVPAGAALIFAGHSLGGMTAQLLRTDETLKARYEILNVLCGGSPLMEEDGEPEGSLHRLTDIFDVIPYIRSLSLCAFIRQIRTAHRENGGYFLNPDGAHNLSYARNDVWGEYDVFGEKGGDAALQFDPALVQSFGDSAG